MANKDAIHTTNSNANVTWRRRPGPALTAVFDNWPPNLGVRGPCSTTHFRRPSIGSVRVSAEPVVSRPRCGDR
ncbi:hypothetical protein JCM12141A_50670 [Mycolicibacterium hodleri]